MKLLAILILLAALFLLYRIAYPKQGGTTKDRDFSERETKSLPDVMGKSRFVLPDRSQALQTPATISQTEKEAEKEFTFAAETEEKRSAVIPAEQLDEVFGNEPNIEIMSLPLEYENEDDSAIDFEVEEAEELQRVLGYEAIQADGIDYDDLQMVVKIVKEQPDEVSEKIAKTLAALEDTDMFEWLVSGDENNANWIKSVVERSIQHKQPKTEDTTSDTDYGNFEISNFL